MEVILRLPLTMMSAFASTKPPMSPNNATNIEIPRFISPSPSISGGNRKARQRADANVDLMGW